MALYCSSHTNSQCFFRSLKQSKFILLKWIYKLTLGAWMTCDVTSFSTVFQSYQDDGRMIMKDCVQRNPVYGLEDLAWNGARTQTARSVDQR